MLIPYQELSEEALKGVAESYVISQLNDIDQNYDVSLWVEKVLKEVYKGELVVTFSQVNQTVSLIAANEIQTIKPEYEDEQ
ncbi:MAG: YheU family protein [Gammaproteobacteria bacterium]|nr:YheU family protein [Gammaproteobacteria bacterium]MDH5630194.1 YheU family protein [Gammaproteobacteria bacterium]